MQPQLPHVCRQFAGISSLCLLSSFGVELSCCICFSLPRSFCLLAVVFVLEFPVLVKRDVGENPVEISFSQINSFELCKRFPSSSPCDSGFSAGLGSHGG